MKPADLKKRKGRIFLPGSELTNPSPAFMKAVFSVFYPVDCRSGHQKSFYDEIEYFGYSPLFDELKDGETIPTYDLVASRKNGGALVTEAIRQE